MSVYFSYTLLPGLPGLGQVGNMKTAAFPTAFQPDSQEYFALFTMNFLSSILLAVY